MRASDIHVEPFENRLAVRYRVDGVLHDVESPPKRLAAAVISRRTNAPRWHNESRASLTASCAMR